MTYPNIPLDIVVRLFIDNQWIDITGDVRGPMVAITGRGSASEQANQNTQTCALSINDRLGTYVDQNPNSIYYDKLGTNTPLRVSVRTHHTDGPLADISDTFTRTSVNSWGAPDSGQNAYTLIGVGGAVLTSDWQVNGGEGKHSVPSNIAYRASMLTDIVCMDFDTTIIFKCPQATGAALEPANIAFRSDALYAYDLARVEVTATNTVICRLIDRNAVEIGVATVSGLTHLGTGQPLKLRVLALGHNIYMKVWIAANAEPSIWHLSAFIPASPVYGFLGVRSGVAFGNTNVKPVVFAVDNFSFITEEPRSSTEVAEWPTRWDTTGTDVYVPIVGSGLRRRLSKGQKPKKSPHTRTVVAAATAPLAYWPLEDAVNSTTATTGLARATGMAPRPNTGPPTFGGEGIITGSSASVSFVDGGTLIGSVDSPTGSEWAVEFVVAIDAPSAGAASAPLVALWRTTGTYDSFECVISNTEIKVRHFELNVVKGEAVAGVTAFDRQVKHIRYYTRQSGGNYLSELYVNGILEDTADNFGSPMVGTIGRPTSIELNPLNSNGLFQPSALSQVTIWGSTPPTAIASAAFGYVGENAATRLVRLGTENDIIVDVRGIAAESILMGPQPTDTLLAIMDLTAQTDQGMLYESRNTLGFEYRVRASLYNLTSVDLSYTAQLFNGEVYPETGDKLLVNSIIGKQITGNEYTYSEEVGKRSIQEYPNGAGLYQIGIDYNTQFDAGLAASTEFAVARGIVLDRIPSIIVNLARSVFTSNPTLTSQILAFDLLSLFKVTNMPAWLPPKDYPVLIQGYMESINGLGTWEIDWNTVPYDPFVVGVWDAVSSRFDTDQSTTASVIITGTTTSFTVTTTAGADLWVTGSGGPNFPIEIFIAGATLNVTAIAGATSPQTFTVDAAPLNGIVKTIPIGVSVRLANPVRYGYI